MNIKRGILKFIFVFFFVITLIEPVFSSNNESVNESSLENSKIEFVNLSYKKTVFVEEEFEAIVNLINFNNDSYDIKFEITNGNKNIAKRFWNGEWKSTNYWVYDFINISETNNKKIKLKINEKYDGFNEFSVKIKNSSDFLWKFNYSINISSNVSGDNFVNDIKEIEIYAELEGDEKEIVNGKEFEINISIFNLKDKNYDVKIWIEDKNNIVSDRYDEENKEWKSGKYYINNFFKGSGNKSYSVKLRINEKYEYLRGESKLFFKIRGGLEIQKNIKILEKTADKKINEVESLEVLIINNSKEKSIGKVIVNNSNSLRENESFLYESKTEKIKKYSVFSFALLCIILSVLIGWKKLE